MAEPQRAAASASPRASSRDAWAAAAVGLGLVLAVVFVYAPVAQHEFVYCDDDRYVFENPVVRAGLTRAGAIWAFSGVHVANWHPLTWLSHMADVTLLGVDSGRHHLVNVGFHAVNALLLFLALRWMTGGLWPPALVAVLFALHPSRVESVAWVAERKDVLSGLFFMGTLLAYAAYARRPGPARYLAVALCLALGLLAKPMLVTLPCLLLLLDLWPMKRWDAQHCEQRAFSTRSAPWLVLEKLPLLALAAASGAAAVWSQTESGAMGNLEVLPFAARLANALESYVRYLGMTLWPSGLAVFYPHPAMLDPEHDWARDSGAIAAALFLLAVTGLALRQLRERPYLAVGWLWYLGTLLPVIGLVQVGDQAMADRYTYLPLIGIYVAAAFALQDLERSRPGLRTPLAFAAGALITAAAIVSAQQVRHWRNTGTLFAHAIAVTQGNYFAHNHLGRYLENQRDLEAATKAYETALELRPGYKGAHSNLGNVLAKRGEYEPALAHFDAALRLDPDFAEAWSNLGVTQGLRGRPDLAIAAYERALELDPSLFAPHYNLGSLLLRRGEIPRAVRLLEQAVTIDPEHADANNNLAVAYVEYGDIDRAIDAYKRTLALAPRHPEARCNLGIALERLGGRETEMVYEQALAENPDCAHAHRYLGYRAIESGDLERAGFHLTEVVRLRPDVAEAHNDLGVLNARRREYPRARAHFERALELAPGNQQAKQNLRQLERDMNSEGSGQQAR